MSASLTLRCDECHATATVRPWLSLTRMGVLRVEGASHGFYVDGGSVLCRACAGDKLNLRPQRETWNEYARRSVEEDQEYEAYLDRIVKRYPGLGRVR